MVVFFDIDGTLVDDRTQIIPESVGRCLKALRSNGHLPVINTGRPFSHIDPRIRAMDFGAWVCGCGMQVILNGNSIYENLPEPEICSYAVDAVRNCRMQAVFEARNSTLLTDGDRSSNPVLQREIRRFEDRGFPVKDLSQLERPEFIKMATFDEADSQHERFKTLMAPWFTCIEREHTMLELVKRGCSKARGMEILLEHLGVTRKDTLAIGDSTNDLPMFEAAEHTVCMGNGTESVKVLAEYVTGAVLEDGIENALKHYGLI